MFRSWHSRFRVVVAVVLVAASAAVAAALDAPSLTIQNNASEQLLVHIVGPSSGYLPVGGSSSRTVTLASGTYRLFFRWGATRYRYTKLDGPFTVADGEEVTLTLYTVAGNTEEEPSSDAEFTNGR